MTENKNKDVYIGWNIVEALLRDYSGLNTRTLNSKLKELRKGATVFNLVKAEEMEEELREMKDKVREMEKEMIDLKEEIDELKRNTEEEDEIIDMDIESRLISFEEVARVWIRNCLMGIEARIIKVEEKKYCNYDIILMKESFIKKFRGVLNVKEIKARKDIRVYMDPKRKEKRRTITKRNYWKAKSGGGENVLRINTL